MIWNDLRASYVGTYLTMDKTADHESLMFFMQKKTDWESGAGSKMTVAKCRDLGIRSFPLLKKGRKFLICKK